MSNPKFIAWFCIGAIIVGFLLYFMNPTPEEYTTPNNNDKDQVVCTLEAMQCPDGSYVGRTGPNCEFASCPIPDGVQMEDGTI